MSTTVSAFNPSKHFTFRLSREQLNEIKRVFDVYDEDYDGLIETKYLSALMRTVGLFPTEKNSLILIKDVDPETTGFINLGSVYVLIARSFRDFGETTTSVKNSLRNLSYVQNIAPGSTVTASKHNTSKGKGSKLELTESVRLVSLQSLQNAMSDSAGEPLNVAERDDFTSHLIAAQQTQPHRDFLCEDVENFILSDMSSSH